jgi:FKBP-type peptidyl-prolyl cis-trans isomerase SlpA
MVEIKPQIAPGCRVRMHFSLTLPDKTEIISTYGEEPLEFTLGDNTMEQMLELALLGLRAGDEQDLLVSGDDVYGARDSSLIHWLDHKQFPADQPLKPGELISFTTPQGEEVAGMVLQIEDGRVEVDFNHLLCGRQFRYRVTILDVTQAPDQEPNGSDPDTCQ